MSKSATPILPSKGKVLANPTKSFFVTMLTRDIELMDAIMDLIDNCIDGVHRQNKKTKKKDEDLIYKGYYAEITINEKEFKIKDNCGGIPLSVAKNYAFRMGRSDEYHDDDNLETLGMYGIGMKRAIFKTGLSAEVTTWNEDDIYKVSIPNNWTTIPEWTFDYVGLKKSEVKGTLSEPGTVLHIQNIHKNISKQFKDESGFLKDLTISLRNHYGYIIQQGFKIKVNKTTIPSLELNIITSTASDARKAVKPYVYTTVVDKVEVEIMVGFYRPFVTEEELQSELDGSYASSQSDNAGITVLCNDRVVLYCDKSFITGWGEPPVPKYHTQFIAIAGVVHFRSNTPINLPVTTTKRGLDTSSAVYATAKIKIKEGLRYFTAFTNDWKTPSDERVQLFKSAKKINALKPGQSKSSLVPLKSAKKDDSAKYQIPELPKPNDAEKNRSVTIIFSKEKQKVADIQNYFFEGEKKSAGEIGSWCFDKMYAKVEK